MRLRTLDLFHGVGGCSIGAREAGAEIIAGIDYWDVAAETYKRNFPEAVTICDDIRKISPRHLKNKIGEIELIVASPECTNHSCARGSRERSEESRKTAYQVTRFTEEFRPKWIIVENVIQMVKWPGYEKIKKKLKTLGYFVKEEKLNAKDFGVPQSRRRLFLLCSLNGKIELKKSQTNKYKPASTIINYNGDYSFTPLYAPGRATPTIERAERAISELGPKVPFLIVYYSTDGSGGWQNLDKPLRTITTLDRFAYIKPKGNSYVMRMLQPEELKLAMGFPKKFRLDMGTRREQIKLLGNAVCPPVMRKIIHSLTGYDNQREIN